MGRITSSRFRHAVTATAALVAISGGVTQAAVLYSSPPNYALTSFAASSAAGAEQECTPFSVATNSTITSIDFWGDYFDNNPAGDSFTIGLYAGSAPPAATAISTQVVTSLTRTATGLTGLRNLPTFLYTATLNTPLPVTGGTQYAMAVLNSNSNWDWQLGQAGTNYFRVGSDGTAWNLSGSPATDSIQINGTVPEPTTLSLCALSAAAVLRRRRS